MLTMIRPRIIPLLLLKGKGLVKTVKFRDPTYVGDPINAVRIFNQKKADELIFLDIVATKEKRSPSLELITKVADECFMPFSIGGGITKIEQIKKLLSIGAEKVSINTAAVENPSFIKDASTIFGSQSIVVSMDVKKNEKGAYELYIEGGRKKTNIDPFEFALEMQKRGAGELLINSIDRDGTMEGYDLPLVKKISDSLDIPVIAAGGAGNIKDMLDVITLSDASAAAAGSIFVFHGRRRAVLIDYPSSEDIENVLNSHKVVH